MEVKFVQNVNGDHWELHFVCLVALETRLFAEGTMHAIGDIAEEQGEDDPYQIAREAGTAAWLASEAARSMSNGSRHMQEGNESEAEEAFDDADDAFLEAMVRWEHVPSPEDGEELGPIEE